QAAFSWWEWHFHPDVVLGVLLLEGLYLMGVGPWRRRYGLASEVKSGQVVLFSLGVLVLFVSLTSPIHHLANNYLFSAHMVQHLLLVLVVPPLILAGTPDWLVRPLFRPRLVLAAARYLTSPLIAFLLFSTVIAVWHLPELYGWALRSELGHITEHLVFIGASVVMWWPVLSPLPEVPRASYPVQVIYLFGLTVPMGFVGAAITFSRRVIYDWYDTVPTLWGLATVLDQQIGGLIMKIVGALVFLGVMTVVFFVWYYREERGEGGQGRLEQSGGIRDEEQVTADG
ncbi:MAG: cytochrome c oxidase assembly protein, partial [Chloroflexi bacterium]|nr:cytochrome c oxidase assembly protein [Chloroflexota bacterium]